MSKLSLSTHTFLNTNSIMHSNQIPWNLWVVCSSMVLYRQSYPLR